MINECVKEQISVSIYKEIISIKIKKTKRNKYEKEIRTVWKKKKKSNQ